MPRPDHSGSLSPEGRDVDVVLDLGPTDLTLDQAVTLLDAATEDPGARLVGLDVTGADGGTTPLSAAAELAQIGDLRSVEQIYQHTDFEDGSELILLLAQRGIDAGVRGAHAGLSAREAARRVQAVYEAMELIPKHRLQEKPWPTVIALLVALGLGFLVFLAAYSLLDNYLAAYLIAAVVAGIAGRAVLRPAKQWAANRNRHWLERGASA